MAIVPTDIVVPPALTPGTTTATTAVQGQVTTSIPAPTDILQIKSTQILPTPTPDLKIGDLIQFLVKDIKANNVGLLYFFGNLIEAKLPPGLKSGDIVKAEVQKQNDSVIFKIKEILASAADTSTNPDKGFILETDSSLTEFLSHKVEFLLKSLDAVLNKNKIYGPHTDGNENLLPFPTIAPEDMNNSVLRELEKSLQILQKVIPKDLLLSDSKKIETALKAIHDGSIVEDLQVTINQLNATLNNTGISHEGKFLIELVKRLYPLKDVLVDSEIGGNFEGINPELKKLLSIITREIDNSNSSLVTQTPSKISFRSTLQQIKASLENLQNIENRDDKSSLLESLIKQTEGQISSAFPNELQGKEDILNNTKKMLGTLESLVQSQEMLNRLEPILQTLKEPQLLLFPFLLSGMFGFGELIVDPDASKQTQDQGNRARRESTKKTFAYQGVVPLPNLGQVQFNAIQTETEIELSFSLEDEEKKTFFESNLGDLRSELLSAGITTNSITLSTSTLKRARVEGLDVEDPLVVL